MEGCKKIKNGKNTRFIFSFREGLNVKKSNKFNIRFA